MMASTSTRRPQPQLASPDARRDTQTEALVITTGITAIERRHEEQRPWHSDYSKRPHNNQNNQRRDPPTKRTKLTAALPETIPEDKNWVNEWSLEDFQEVSHRRAALDKRYPPLSAQSVTQARRLEQEANDDLHYIERLIDELTKEKRHLNYEADDIELLPDSATREDTLIKLAVRTRCKAGSIEQAMNRRKNIKTRQRAVQRRIKQLYINRTWIRRLPRRALHSTSPHTQRGDVRRKGIKRAKPRASSSESIEAAPCTPPTPNSKSA